jgi:hypothetical protein
MPGRPEVDSGCHRRTPRYNAQDDTPCKEDKRAGLNVLGTTATRMGPGSKTRPLTGTSNRAGF